MSRATLNRITQIVAERAKTANVPLEPFTVHDLRRTGSTLLNEAGFNRDWIEKCLAHEQRNSPRSIYNKAEYAEQRRHMLQEWADMVDAWVEEGAYTSTLFPALKEGDKSLISQLDKCQKFLHNSDKEGRFIMQTIAKQVLEYAAGLPEGTPLVAKELLHLGGRAAVDQVLSRLVKRGALLRAGRGIYVLPVESRFGTHAPSTNKLVEGLAGQRGETIVPHGAAAANALGLTTQVPMKAIYLTSGRNRRLRVGAQTVEFRHAPIWQLIFPGRPAGEVVRALAWLGPEKAGEALRKLRSKLQPSELEEVASARARLPTWMAQEVSALLAHG